MLHGLPIGSGAHDDANQRLTVAFGGFGGHAINLGDRARWAVRKSDKFIAHGGDLENFEQRLEAELLWFPRVQHKVYLVRHLAGLRFHGMCVVGVRSLLFGVVNRLLGEHADNRCTAKCAGIISLAFLPFTAFCLAYPESGFVIEPTMKPSPSRAMPKNSNQGRNQPEEWSPSGGHDMPNFANTKSPSKDPSAATDQLNTILGIGRIATILGSEESRRVPEPEASYPCSETSDTRNCRTVESRMA